MPPWNRVKIGAVTKNGYTFNPATGRITITEGRRHSGPVRHHYHLRRECCGFLPPDLGDQCAGGSASSRSSSRIRRAIHPRRAHGWAPVWVDADGEFQVPDYGNLRAERDLPDPPVIDERKN